MLDLWKVDLTEPQNYPGQQLLKMLCAEVLLMTIDDGDWGTVFVNSARVCFLSKHESLHFDATLPVRFIVGKCYLVPVIVEEHSHVANGETLSRWCELRLDGVPRDIKTAPNQ